MVNRRGAVALTSAAALVCSVGLFAQKDDKKQEEALKKETKNVIKIADGVAAGQPMANDLSLAWAREDFLKAQGNKEYVPFTVTIDPSKVTSPNVAIYWRVVFKAPLPVTAPPAAGKKEEKKEKKGEYAYEDISFVPLTQGQTAPMRISRSFTVTPGIYDVFVIVKEPTPQQKNAPAPKISMLKQAVTVPDFWNDDLNTSTVIVAQRIDPLSAPLTPQEQADRPYALGAMEILPVLDLKLSKKNELSTFMLIYNPKVDSGNKPDVSVEYNFYLKLAGQPEKFFNKTNPQNLNAQTLPPQFDLAAGHQLQSGQAVPLASFPEGDYRLEIKVTDKIANRTLTREINFTVSPS